MLGRVASLSSVYMTQRSLDRGSFGVRWPGQSILYRRRRRQGFVGLDPAFLPSRRCSSGLASAADGRPQWKYQSHVGAYTFLADVFSLWQLLLCTAHANRVWSCDSGAQYAKSERVVKDNGGSIATNGPDVLALEMVADGQSVCPVTRGQIREPPRPRRTFQL